MPGEHRRRGRRQRRARAARRARPRALERRATRRRHAERAAAARAGAAARLRFQRKDTEQYHVCLGAPGISRSDRRRFAASILDAILGGSASSRLFQEIREKRGMAYSVYIVRLAVHGHRPDRHLPRHARGQPRRGARDRRRADRRHRRRQPAATRELERAKENLKGRILLSMESTSTRMNRLGKSLITDSELLSLDRIVAEIDAVETESRVASSPRRCSRRSGCRRPGSARARSGSSRRSSAITPTLARAA